MDQIETDVLLNIMKFIHLFMWVLHVFDGYNYLLNSLPMCCQIVNYILVSLFKYLHAHEYDISSICTFPTELKCQKDVFL